MTDAKGPRLPFRLHDFTRIIWHSEAARAVWEPRLSRINTAWNAIEQQAVVERFKDACLTFVPPEQLTALTHRMWKQGVLVMPLTQTGMSAQYSATPQPVQFGHPWQYRVVLTTPEFADAWLEQWNRPNTDNKEIGKLLNYPPCCINFFERVWVNEQSIDTTWEMAWHSPLKDQAEPYTARSQLLVVPETTSPLSNILLRWLGVRFVPHLPCSFDCQATIAQARRFLELGSKLYQEEVTWMYEMLSWPAEWSALHGIAEVRTPILTVSTRTDATGPKLVVQKEGDKYPDEGANGLRFPFRIVKGKVTEKPAFQRALVPVHELNGFSSEEAMDQAHAVLLACLPEREGFFLDLGSGTGRLLERLAERGWSVAGLEIDNTRAGAAKLPTRRGNVLDTSLWAGMHYDVIAFMPGRLLEGCTEDQAKAVREALRTAADAVLLYGYGDWLKKNPSGIDGLVALAGFKDYTVLSRGPVHENAQAILVKLNPQDPT